MYGYFVLMYVYSLFVMPSAQRPEKGIKLPGAKVTDSGEPCGNWKPNPGLLEEPVLLTAKSPLQPQSFTFSNVLFFLYFVCLLSIVR